MKTLPSQSLREAMPTDPSRRRFFMNSLGSVAAGSAACCGLGSSLLAAQQGASSNYTPSRPLDKATRDAMTPDEIIALAKAGNRRFLDGNQRSRDMLAELKIKSAGQFPAAVMLSCIDSRAPAEIIFDLGLGDIFNCRVAGNIDTPDLLGSMEFATKVAGAKVVAVLGHSACGAVQGAIAGAKLGNLTQLLAKIRPAIDQTTFTGERTAENMKFVDAVAKKNVELTIERIRLGSDVIADLERSGAVKIVGGFFDLETGKVDFFV
jgi:carbonic anhydrase